MVRKKVRFHGSQARWVTAGEMLSRVPREEQGKRYLEVLSFGKKGTMITLEGAVSS